MLSGQALLFTIVVVLAGYRVVLSDDPALAMAFSVARRAAAVPVLLVNGTYRASNRVYLDSLLLQGQLQSLGGFGTNSGYSLVLYFYKLMI